MNRFRAWGLTAAVAAAGGPAVAADPPPRPAGQPTTVMAKLFGPPKPKADPAAAAGRPPVPAPLPAEVVNAALKAEQDAWQRRVAVCDKLREAAAAKNDDALMQQADELERQAAAVYAARVAALGVAKPKPGEAAAALDRQLGTGAAVTPLTAPAPPAPAAGTASARKTGDAVREVKP